MRFKTVLRIFHILVYTKCNFMVTGRGAERFSRGVCLLDFFSLPLFLEIYLLECMLHSSISICLEFKSIPFVHINIYSSISLLFRQ